MVETAFGLDYGENRKNIFGFFYYLWYVCRIVDIYIGRSILWCKMIFEVLKTFLVQPIVALVGAIFCWFTILFCAIMKDRESKR